MTEKELYQAALNECYMNKDTLRRRAMAVARSRVTEPRGAKTMKKRLPVALAVAGLAGLLSVGAGAAFLLSPRDAAKKAGWTALENAFTGSNAVVSETTQTDAGYSVTLLGAADGSALKAAFDGLDPAQFYSVVAFANEDGTAMTEADQGEFSLSPYISGHAITDYNLATLGGGGGGGSKLMDGVLYQYVSCSSLGQYADDTLYLSVSDSYFPQLEAYTMDDATGAITPNDEYDGLNVLFTLPESAFSGAAAVKVESRPSEPVPTNTTAALPAGSIDEKLFPEGVSATNYGSGSELLVTTATRLCLYNTQTGGISAEIPLPQEYLDFRASLNSKENMLAATQNYTDYTVYPLDDGYMSLMLVQKKNDAGAAKTGDDATTELTCTFYDNALQVKDTVLLNSETTGIERFIPLNMDMVKPTPSGSKIVFDAMFDGVFAYDRATKGLTELIDYSYSEDAATEADRQAARLGISFLSSMAFSPDESTLYFTAGTLHFPAQDGDTSFATAGSVRLDGTGLTNAARADYPLDQFTQRGDTLLYNEQHGLTTGRLLLQSLADGTEHIWPLTAENEDKDAVALSRDGDYFATGLLTTDRIPILTVRVYESATGALVAEQTIRPAELDTDATGAMGYLDVCPTILMLDDSRTCVLQLGHTKAKYYTFGF